MVRAFIFDLGNVLINIDVDKIFQSWGSRAGLDWRKIRDGFEFDEIYNDFERGSLSPAEYFDYIRTKFDIPLTNDLLEQGWNAIFTDLVSGVENLIRGLAKRYRIVVLSNTNETHINFFSEAYHEILQQFEQVFYSNKIGARKPEIQAYQTVLDYLQVRPEEVVFLDDKYENIAAARKMGIIGIEFTAYEAAVAELKQIGVELEKAS